MMEVTTQLMQRHRERWRLRDNHDNLHNCDSEHWEAWPHEFTGRWMVDDGKVWLEYGVVSTRQRPWPLKDVVRTELKWISEEDVDLKLQYLNECGKAELSEPQWQAGMIHQLETDYNNAITLLEKQTVKAGELQSKVHQLERDYFKKIELTAEHRNRIDELESECNIKDAQIAYLNEKLGGMLS